MDSLRKIEQYREKLTSVTDPEERLLIYSEIKSLESTLYVE